MNVDFGGNKTPVEVIKEGAFISEIFIQVLMVNGIENNGKNLMIYRILIKIIIVQTIIMLVVINIKLNEEHH